jgi:predicted dehydrogenase
MPKRIKCGVIGAGWWATYAHIPALLAHPAAELVAIQKRDLVEARKVANDFGVPMACATTAELLAIVGLEAVVVSSSPNLHYEHAVAALELGKHVLIEKPMTMTAVEAGHLVEIAQERGLQFLISCPWHYTAHGAEAQRLVRSGHLGSVRLISILMTNPISHLLRGSGTVPTHGEGTPYMHPRPGTYSDPKIAGGGQIYAQISHVAAYLTFLTGAWPAEVFARFHNDGEAVDIYDVLSLRMSDGSLVSIASTGATSTSRRDFEVRVFGTEGMLFMDLWRGQMEFEAMTGERRVYPQLSEEEIYPHMAPAMNLIDSILDPSANVSPAILGQAAMDAVEAACKSAESGNDIRVSSKAGDAACIDFK